eukprot:scaffold22126_cov70-Phaeocystis_antarctica.AAC.8
MPWRAVGRLWEEAGGGPEKANGKTTKLHVVVVTSSSNSLQSGNCMSFSKTTCKPHVVRG